MRWPSVAAAGLLAFAGWQWARQQEEYAASLDGLAQGVSSDATEFFDKVAEGVSDVANSLTGYSYSKVPERFRGAIASAEVNYGLPDQMLARLLWQESRYKDSIITGAVRSPAGAMGIAQFMPATAADMGVDPLDPFAAIDAAGRYLRSLYRQTGDWSKALAAYNWGIGNVLRKGMSRAPLETRNYFSQILADIGLGGTYA